MHLPQGGQGVQEGRGEQLAPEGAGREGRVRAGVEGAHCTAGRGACTRRCTAVAAAAVGRTAAAVVSVFVIVVEWVSAAAVGWGSAGVAAGAGGAQSSFCGVPDLARTYLVRSGVAAACYYCAQRTYAPGDAACRTGQRGSSAGTPRTYCYHPVWGCKFHSGRYVDEVAGKHFPEIRYVE